VLLCRSRVDVCGVGGEDGGWIGLRRRRDGMMPWWCFEWRCIGLRGLVGTVSLGYGVESNGMLDRIWKMLDSLDQTTDATR
jgi:hypothetical protein